ncbi:hypothetical protein DGMP_01210 [Desulfomarina profundi]|uniref:Polysaccharide biosynthesis protein C-terminal domain-containing protein n=1 Tax=Desulfomarina profundi TaxID=2772557 RepID=A0A8D5FDS3_9BACT|nr:hypothetical protein DGMP_01210 [Desulfomarina profundi]
MHDYGLLALANTALLFLYAIGKSGIPNSLITQLSEKAHTTTNNIYFNALLTVSGTTLLTCCTYLLFLFIIKHFFSVPVFFYFLPILVIFRNFFAVSLSRLQAREKITQYNILSASLETGSTITVLFFLFLSVPTVDEIFKAKIVFESIFIILALYFPLRLLDKLDRIISKELIKKLLSFGIPLVWLEISMIIMTFGDRYQIGYLNDAKSVGLYTAGYNLAQYMQQIITQPLSLAIYPIYNKLFTEKGETETGLFLDTVLRYYFAVTIPLLIFLTVHAKILLSFLASEKYQAAATVVPIVFLGNLINGAVPIISAGLYLSRNTKILGKITVYAAISNIILNWYFISVFGYVGAAFTTLLSFMFLFLLVKHNADRLLKIKFPVTSCFLYLSFAICAVLPSFLFTETKLLPLILSSIIFILIYSSLTIATDRKLSGYLKNYFFRDKL